MDSFNTDARTKKMIRNYEGIKIFNQSQFPRISAENMMPIGGDQMYYPPGHGDIFYSLNKSGLYTFNNRSTGCIFLDIN